MSLFEKSGPSRRTNAFSSAQKLRSERPFHARRRSRGGSFGDGDDVPFELNIKDIALLSSTGKQDAEEKTEPQQRDFTIGNLPDDMQRFLDGGSLDGSKDASASASTSTANPFAMPSASATASAANPFAVNASASNANPFAMPSASAANPFAVNASASAANPFAMPSASTANPFTVNVSSAEEAKKSTEASAPSSQPSESEDAATKSDDSPCPPKVEEDSSEK